MVAVNNNVTHEALRRVIERDRFLVSKAIMQFENALYAYSWLREGRGPYEYSDDKWMNEFKFALQLLEKAIEPLRSIAIDKSYCPTDWDEILKARRGEI